MGRPGVAAHHPARGGDQGQELQEAGIAGQHGRDVETGQLGDLRGQAHLAGGAGEHYGPPGREFRPSHRRPSLGGPTPRSTRGSGVKHGRAPYRIRDINIGRVQLEVLRVSRNARFLKEPAPSVALVFVLLPLRPFWQAEGDEASGPRRGKQRRALWT